MGRDDEADASTEDDIDSLVDQLDKIKTQQANAATDESDCEMCSPPIQIRDTRKRSVSDLMASHENFHGYTNADYLRVCKSCGSILSTSQVKNLK